MEIQIHLLRLCIIHFYETFLKFHYKKFKLNGGDGFYAAWACPFNELVTKNSKKNKIISKDFINALKLQKNLFLFKTNYRNLNDAKKQANILKKTINQINYNFQKN